MQIREIDPNDPHTQYGEPESFASKFRMPKIKVPVITTRTESIHYQPVPQPVAQMQPQPPQNDSVPVYPKKRIVYPTASPKPTEPLKMAPLAAPRPTPTHPLPVYVPPQPEEFMDTDEIYGSATAYAPAAITATRTPRSFKPKLALNFSMKKMPLLVAEGVVGFVAIYLGLTQTGSYYTPASRFAGELATVFYGYQLGTLAAMVGVVLIYDAIRRAGNL